MLLALGGCAANTYDSRSAQLAYWSNHYEKQAAAGDLKWSEYYKGLYAHFFFIPELPGYDLYLRWSIAQLEAALAVEGGKVSAEAFTSFRNQMNLSMRSFAASGGRQRSAEQIDSFDLVLRLHENQAMGWYGKAINCVATDFNRVYTAKCE